MTCVLKFQICKAPENHDFPTRNERSNGLLSFWCARAWSLRRYLLALGSNVLLLESKGLVTPREPLRSGHIGDTKNNAEAN